jgi:bacterioferritin-associated ferredoxin
MYVCICHAVTDSDIRQAVDKGARSMRDLREGLGVSSQCGRCARCARQCLSNALSEQFRVEIEAA